ncbi:hypothetical protein FN846DRAFT_885714 [Sphaerosporella brunnea]|uniref:Uncharacterized protein n=1 Tax=Sphaerosporella brunnea TaxID=1250544 RepID=A0A5J5FBQ4_9PEZI|nr:hypothetical protein FN846DRAFT_885714 [Sphaerosporella brunnea]
MTRGKRLGSSCTNTRYDGDRFCIWMDQHSNLDVGENPLGARALKYHPRPPNPSFPPSSHLQSFPHPTPPISNLPTIQPNRVHPTKPTQLNDTPNIMGKTRPPPRQLRNKSATPLASNAGNVANPNTTVNTGNVANPNLTANTGNVANPNTTVNTGNNSAPVFTGAPTAPSAPTTVTLGFAGGPPSQGGSTHAPPPRDLLNKTATSSSSNAGNVANPNTTANTGNVSNSNTSANTGNNSAPVFSGAPTAPSAPTTVTLGFAGGRPSQGGSTHAPPPRHLLNKTGTPSSSNAGNVANPNTTNPGNVANPNPTANTGNVANPNPTVNTGNSSTDKRSQDVSTENAKRNLKTLGADCKQEDSDRPPPPKAKRRMASRKPASGDSVPLFAIPSAQGSLPGQFSVPTVFAGPLNAIGSPNTAQGLLSTPTPIAGAPPQMAPLIQQPQMAPQLQPQPQMAQFQPQQQMASLFQPQPPQFGPQSQMAPQFQHQAQMYAQFGPQQQMYQQLQHSSAHLQYQPSWLHPQSLMPARPALTTSIDTSPAIGYLEAIAAQRVAPEPVYHWTPPAAPVRKVPETPIAPRVRKLSEPSPTNRTPASPTHRTPAYRVTKYTPPVRERVVTRYPSSYIGEPPLRRQRTERKPVEWRMLTVHETVKPRNRQPTRLITIDGRIMFALSLVVAWWLRP